MLERKNLTGILFSFSILLGVFTTSCHTKKEVIDNTEKTTTTQETQIEEIKEEVTQVVKNTNTATLNCQGKSSISLLQLADKKYDTDDFICKVSREKDLRIQWTSESKKLEIIFNIVGIETTMIKSKSYQSKSSNAAQYIDVSLNSKSLGQHNFGESFEGFLEIIDYGNSSDVVCGKFAVIDRKGNKIEGTFNETIRTF